MVVHTCTTDPGGDAGAGFEGSSGLFKKKNGISFSLVPT